jgi:hypothetical protein
VSTTFGNVVYLQHRSIFVTICSYCSLFIIVRQELFVIDTTQLNTTIIFKVHMANKQFVNIGSFGDTLYSLCVVKMLGGGDLYIKLNGMDEQTRRLFGREPDGYHKGRYTQADYDFLEPLLKKQDYLTKVAIWNGEADHEPSLSNHWQQHLIKGWQGNQTECYALTQGMNIHDPAISKQLLQEPWLTPVEPIVIPGKPIVINRTNRYLYGCDGKKWHEWVKQGLGDKAVFLGSPTEHAEFEKEFNVKVEYRPVKDLLEMAQIIQGCEQFMGNQSVALCIAIGLGKTFWCEIRKDWNNIKTPHGLGDVWFPRVNGHYF